MRPLIKVILALISILIFNGCAPVIHVKNDGAFYTGGSTFSERTGLNNLNIDYIVQRLNEDPLVAKSSKSYGSSMILEIPINGMLERVITHKTGDIVVSGSNPEYFAKLKPNIEFKLLTDTSIEKAAVDVRIYLSLTNYNGEVIINKYYNSGWVAGEWFSMFKLSTYGCHGCGPIYDEEFSKVAFKALNIVVDKVMSDIEAELMLPNKRLQLDAAPLRD